MTRQACLGRKGLSDLTLGPYVTPSGGSVGVELSSPFNWKGRKKPGDLESLSQARVGGGGRWVHLELGSVSGSGQGEEVHEESGSRPGHLG